MNARIYKQTRLFGILIACVALITSLGWAARLFSEASEKSACSALWSTAQSGDNYAVEHYLKEGVDPNCDHGEALKRARDHGHEDTVTILKRYGAKE